MLRGKKFPTTVIATFDGEVLRPDEPLDLEPNTRVRITIEAIESPAEKTLSFLDTAASLDLDGPGRLVGPNQSLIDPDVTTGNDSVI